MEKLKKQKTTRADSQKGSQSNASGLIYWEDYNFDNQTDTAGYLKHNFKLNYNRR